MRNIQNRFDWLSALIIFSIAAFTAHGEDFYVAQSILGNGNGASATNSKALSFFNSETSWSSPIKVSGKIGPGDTVHLVGTITMPLIVQASGLAGKPITILFEFGAKMSHPAWPSTPNSTSGGAIAVSRKDYITIDGGANGVIENTANGTGLTNSVCAVGINGTSASFFTVRNLTIRNLYVRKKGSEYSPGSAAISNTAKNDDRFTDFLVENCTISDVMIGIDTDYTAGCANYTFRNNTIYNCNWGGRCGDRRSSSTITNVTIANNNFFNFTNWDGTDNATQAAFHHNGFYCWAESGGTFNKVTAYGNKIGPNFTSVSPNGATSGLFFSGSGMIGPILIHSNLFVENTADSPSNGNIFVWPAASAVTRIYNNTFVGGGTGIAIGYEGVRGGSLYIANNLCTGKNFIYVTNNTLVRATIDNNLGYNLSSGQEYSWSSNSSLSARTFAQWQNLGFDIHGINSNPYFVSSTNFALQSSSPAKGSGMDLSNYFTIDKEGNTRSSWDIGAYSLNEASVAIEPPRNATITLIQ